MKNILLLSLIVLTIGVKAFSQNQFPSLDKSSLVSTNYDIEKLDKPYTLIIYGGVSCGYSQYLIKNLDVLSDCKVKCDIILIMDKDRETIYKYMGEVVEKYPTFTNTVLQYKLKKKSDIFPQSLLFKNRVQISHIVGVKNGMLTNTKKIIMEDN